MERDGDAGDEGLLRALAEARALGFLGPGPVEAHVRHAEAFLQVWPGARAGRALDLGSGGGVPGLVLAQRLPTWRWTLLDVSSRRARFLTRSVSGLGWTDRVEVVEGSAERVAHTPAHRAAYDVVTARSFAAPAATAEVGGAFLGRGGLLLVSDPPVEDEKRWPADALLRLGLEVVIRSEEPAIVVLQRIADIPPDVPRETARRRPRY